MQRHIGIARVKPKYAEPGTEVEVGKLDGLQKRMKEYFDLGCRFAKWRAVITIGAGTSEIMKEIIAKEHKI